jgi:hypothetical protein
MIRTGGAILPTGQPDAEDDLVRRHLIRLVSRRGARVVRFSEERPCEWRPTTVLNPRTGICFSPLEAWHFIEEQLEAGCEIKVVELHWPPGRTAYVLKIEVEPGTRAIYVKLEPCGNKVFGRSFHYSALEST